jgi:hypothetical protein
MEPLPVAHPRNKVPFYAHPFMCVFTSILSVIAGLFSVLAIQWVSKDIATTLQQAHAPPDVDIVASVWPLRWPWVSLGIGLAVGFPSIFVAKRMLRRRAALFAGFVLAPLRQRVKWCNYRQSLIGCLPFVVGPWVAVAVAALLKIAPFPAFFGTGMWAFLTLPESRAIYEAAKSRVTYQEAI